MKLQSASASSRCRPRRRPCPRPGEHHVRVVDRDADDRVHALDRQPVRHADEARARGRRGRCGVKAPGSAEEHHLARPATSSAERHRLAARFRRSRRNVASGSRVADLIVIGLPSVAGCMTVTGTYRVYATKGARRKDGADGAHDRRGRGRPGRRRRWWRSCRASGSPARSPWSATSTAPPYQRPPLSKAYLLGEMALERLYLRPASFYEDNGITLLLGTPVDRHRPRGQDRSALDGDAFCPTTCSRSPPARAAPPAGRDRRRSRRRLLMRSLADADALAAAILARARPGADRRRRLHRAGGGRRRPQEGARRHPCRDGRPRILHRVAAPATADYFRDLHAATGVDIREGAGLARLTGDGARAAAPSSTDGSTCRSTSSSSASASPRRPRSPHAAGLADRQRHRRRRPRPHLRPGDLRRRRLRRAFPMDGGRLRLESVPQRHRPGRGGGRQHARRDAAYVPKPVVLVGPVRRQAADRRAEHRLRRDRRAGDGGARELLVFRRRHAARGRRDERSARLHDRQAADRGGQERPTPPPWPIRHRPQGAVAA